MSVSISHQSCPNCCAQRIRFEPRSGGTSLASGASPWRADLLRSSPVGAAQSHLEVVSPLTGLILQNDTNPRLAPWARVVVPLRGSIRMRLSAQRHSMHSTSISSNLDTCDLSSMSCFNLPPGDPSQPTWPLLLCPSQGESNQSSLRDGGGSRKPL